MKQIDVICCNDSVEAVVLPTSKKPSREIKESLAEGHYGRLKTSDTYGEYRSHYYWHIHTVPFFE